MRLFHVLGAGPGLLWFERGCAGMSVVRRKPRYGRLACILAVIALVCAACSLPGGGAGGAAGSGKGQTPVPATPTVAAVALTQLHWCGKPTMTFRDDAAASAPTKPATVPPAARLGPANGTPVALTNWSVVKANLGFTIFLPATLPGDTCLLSAASTLRHALVGSNFVITYVLANHDSITFSQAPQRTAGAAFQCNPAQGLNTTSKQATPTPGPARDPVQLCSGTRDGTNIVFSARGTASVLQQLFQSLQPNTDWIPTT